MPNLSDLQRLGPHLEGFELDDHDEAADVFSVCFGINSPTQACAVPNLRILTLKTAVTDLRLVASSIAVGCVQLAELELPQPMHSNCNWHEVFSELSKLTLLEKLSAGASVHSKSWATLRALPRLSSLSLSAAGGTDSPFSTFALSAAGSAAALFASLDQGGLLFVPIYESGRTLILSETQSFRALLNAYSKQERKLRLSRLSALLACVAHWTDRTVTQHPMILEAVNLVEELSSFEYSAILSQLNSYGATEDIQRLLAPFLVGKAQISLKSLPSSVGEAMRIYLQSWSRKRGSAFSLGGNPGERDLVPLLLSVVPDVVSPSEYLSILIGTGNPIFLAKALDVLTRAKEAGSSLVDVFLLQDAAVHSLHVEPILFLASSQSYKLAPVRFKAPL